MTQRRASRRAATAQSLAGGAQEAHGLSSFRPEGAAARGGPITALLTADQQALPKRDREVQLRGSHGPLRAMLVHFSIHIGGAVPPGAGGITEYCL